MDNKLIIDKLKKQVKILVDRVDWSDDNVPRDWVDKTKIYILGLWLDKRDDYFKKEVINMLEKYKDKIPKFDNRYDLDYDMEKKAISILIIRDKLKNVLESFIEILEIREKQLSEEEKKEAKKSKKK